MRQILIILSITYGLSSCLKKEVPVAKHESEGVLTASVSMSNDYRYQVFYDLETNQSVKQNNKTDWSLGFSSESSSIILNSSLSMSVAKTSESFQTISDTAGLIFLYDNSSGDLDSTAFGDWQNEDFRYVVNAGVSYDGTYLGFVKMDILNYSDGTFDIRLAKLDGSDEQIISISTDPNYNFSFFSILDRQIKEIQPPKNDWDLVFTTYNHLFVDYDLQYSVSGVLSNRNGVEVAEIIEKPFEEITLEDADSNTLSSNIDEIGYDWKSYSGGTYTVNLEKSFLVKSTEGIYFKFHFIDFYDEQGQKGTPTFEVQQL